MADSDAHIFIWGFAGTVAGAMIALGAITANTYLAKTERKNKEDAKKRREYRVFVAFETIHTMPREAPAYVVRRTTEEDAHMESEVTTEAARALSCYRSADIAELVDGIWGDYEPGKTIFLEKYTRPGFTHGVRVVASNDKTTCMRLNYADGYPSTISCTDTQRTYLRVITADQPADSSCQLKGAAGAGM